MTRPLSKAADASGPSATSRIVGPNGFPFLGVIPNILKDPLRFLTLTHQKYGDIARFDIGRRPAYLVCEPELIGEVLRRDKVPDRVGMFSGRLRGVFGEGVLTARGELWKSQRATLQPLFNRTTTTPLANDITQVASEYVAETRRRCSGPLVRNIQHDLSTLISALALQTLFGPGAARVHAHALTRNFAVLNDQLFTHLLFGGLGKLAPQREFRRAQLEVEQIIAALLTDETDERGSLPLVDVLRTAHAEARPGFTTKHLHDHVMTLLFAAHETTALALTWTCHLLAQHPDSQRRIADEVTAFRGTSSRAVPVGELGYTSRVIREALRLYPPLYVLTPNMGTEGITNFYGIPRNSQLIISPWLMHRHPRFWDAPGDFEPDRFKDGENRPRFVYFPFGIGPRACIGAQLAMMEMTIVVAELVAAFELSMAPNHRIVPTGRLTLKPKSPLHVVITPRT